MKKADQHALLKTLQETPNGKPLEFPALLPALCPDPIQGVITERDEEAQFWHLQLYWLSVPVAKVTAQFFKGDLLLEVL